jgi:hypothetical protein
MTASSDAALRHLKKIKPLDGWAVQKTAKGYRLLRRNVPLSDNAFLDIHHDSTKGAVVGILSAGRQGKANAQVLVDARGTPALPPLKMVQVAGWDAAAARTKASTTTSTSRSGGDGENSSGVPVLSDEQNMQLVKFGAMGIAGLVLLKTLLRTFTALYILALPVLYLYLVQQCPSDESFEVKRELKRIMRGHHLPEDHPDKPKGFFSETLARLNASLTAEVATGLGYEVTMIPLAGAGKVACVRVPAYNKDFFWVGAVGRWFYVYSTELGSEAD